MLTAIVMYLVFGAFAGVLAGLLGVGGGLIIVPILNYSFIILSIQSPDNHKIALGTSLASIMFTSVSSFMAHQKNGAINWSLVKQISAGIIIGTFSGAQVAKYIPTIWLKYLFVVFLYYVATQMLLNFKPNASRNIPGIVGNSIAGVIIGVMSSLVGIGGGSLSVPYMTWCNVPMKKAIGTSSAIGFPIAVAGAVGYIIAGYGMPTLPEYSFGFVYLPALAGLVTASIFTAPFGAKLAHSLPVPTLKKYFSILLYVMATQMLWSILTQ